MKNNNDPAAQQQYGAAAHRLAEENYQLVQKEVAELADLYEKEPATRFPMSTLLYSVALQRNDSAEAFKPIVPTLIAHLRDPDTKTREGAIRAIGVLRPRPPFAALEALLYLARTETEHENANGAIGVVATLCEQSKQAVFAMRDAAAADQPNQKRAAALAIIGNSPCRDSELVDAVAEGLKSDQLNIRRAAVQAAGRFGPSAAPLKRELENIAADTRDTQLAAKARDTLNRLQR